MQLISESINNLIEEYTRGDYRKRASRSIVKRVKNIFINPIKDPRIKSKASFRFNIGKLGKAIKIVANHKIAPLKHVVGNTIKDSVTNFNDALHKTGSDIGNDFAKATSAVGRRIFRGTNPPDKLDKRTTLGVGRIAAIGLGGLPGQVAALGGTQAYNFGKLSKERETFSNLSKKMDVAKNEYDTKKITNKSGFDMSQIKDRANKIHQINDLKKKLKEQYNTEV